MVDVNFDGIVIPDHIPGIGNPPPGTQAAGGAAGRGAAAAGFRPNPGLAYLLGAMNVLLRAAQSKG